MGLQVGGDSQGPGSHLNSEINVTPFVDVMLVLLVIFMVTMPLVNAGVDIDIPEVNAQNIDDPTGKLTLQIGKDRKLFLGADKTKMQISWASLRVKLETNARVQADKTLWIAAEKSLPYEIVVTAMAEARAAGVSRLMMLTDPSDALDPAKLDAHNPTTR